MKEKESKCKNPYIYRYDLRMAREATTAQLNVTSFSFF